MQRGCVLFDAGSCRVGWAHPSICEGQCVLQQEQVRAFVPARSEFPEPWLRSVPFGTACCCISLNTPATAACRAAERRKHTELLAALAAKRAAAEEASRDGMGLGLRP